MIKNKNNIYLIIYNLGFQFKKVSKVYFNYFFKKQSSNQPLESKELYEIIFQMREENDSMREDNALLRYDNDVLKNENYSLKGENESFLKEISSLKESMAKRKLEFFVELGKKDDIIDLMSSSVSILVIYLF